MKTGLPALVEAMTRPEFYPHPAAAVELIQTHISYVLLAGGYAYKVKKPVRFPFLDCSALADRYRFCAEEVRLNRRLAPEVYLGVLPIFHAQGRFALGSPVGALEPRAFEYAVKMRCLPEDRMLHRLLGLGAVGKEDVRRLAERLARFHLEASSARSWTYGSAAAIWRTLIDDLEQNRRFVGDTLSERELEAIEEHCRAFMMSHWELLNDRARERRVREGHGDLRCEHVCLTEPLAIFDCLEFSERLRYCDVASEIAFLAMDLDRLGAPALADELVTAYAKAASDDALKLLAPFYKCFRASVRGKVESLRSLEPEVPAPERARAREAARKCFALALHYARSATPAMYVVCGPAGTGKSTLARMLQLRTGFEILNSDRIRKGLAGMPPTAHAPEEYNAGIYSPDFTRRTYEALREGAERTLVEGCGVIVDATFREPAQRRMFLGMAAAHGAPVLFVECQAPKEEVLHRLRERERKADEVSDATAEIYLRQLAEFAPLDEIPARSHLAIDTSEDAERIMRRLEEALARLLSPAPPRRRPTRLPPSQLRA